MERAGVRKLFVNGSEFNIERISPKIHICRTRTDFEIFRYCSFFQSVPSGQRIGRRISVLVYDEGQRDTPVLMGVISLASSMYTMGSRDKYLGWTGENTRALKEVGLKRMMDLALCMSIPPYSFLLGGKLMAMLSLSDPVRDEFRKKYGSALLGVATSCATGIHCPIFNRIMIKAGGLYRHIGDTVGYTITFFSPNTMRAARILTARALKSIQDKTEEGELSLRPMRVLSEALKLCDLPSAALLRLGLRKAVYFASLSEKGLVYLRTGNSAVPRARLPTAAVVDHWRTAFLQKRKEHPETLARVKAFRVEDLVPGGKVSS
jgi:hypothetical protein